MTRLTASRIFIACYGLGVIVLCFAIYFGWPTKPRIFETAHFLPKNHLIAAGDVVYATFFYRMLDPSKTIASDFIGRYTAQDLPAQSAIDLGLTSREPDFHPGPGAYLAWIALSQPRDTRIDAGKRVELCGLTKGTRCRTVSVGAVDCRAANGDCRLGVWLDESGRSAFLALEAATAHAQPLHVFIAEAPLKYYREKMRTR